MSNSRMFAGRAAVACLSAVLAGACTSGDEPTSVSSAAASVLRPPEGLGLRPVVLPDFSTMEEPVRKQMLERSSSLRLKIEHPGTAPLELSTVYGEMGKLLMA